MDDTTTQPEENQAQEDVQTQAILKALMEIHNQIDDIEARLTDLEDEEKADMDM
jgi:hypothetical protein